MFCFLVQIRAFLVLNLAGITKFKYERKNEMDFGSSSKMTPSCKWRFGQYLTGRSPVTFVQETRNRTVMSTSMSKKRVEGEIKQSNFIFASASQFCCLSCQCMTTT